jgi:hypothetical protein
MDDHFNEGNIMCLSCKLPVNPFIVYGQGSHLYLCNTSSQLYMIVRNKYTNEWKIVRESKGCDSCPIYQHMIHTTQNLPTLWNALLPTVSHLFNQIMNIITDFYFQKSMIFLQHIKVQDSKLFFRYHTNFSLLCHYKSYIHQPILLPSRKDPLWALPILSIISRILILFDMTYLDETITLAKQYSITHLPRTILLNEIQKSTNITNDVVFIIIDYFYSF